MASKLFHSHTPTRTPTLIANSYNVHLSPVCIPYPKQSHLPILRKPSQSLKVFSLSTSQNLSSPPSKPPSTREEAISQAKTSLSSSLMKPLNNPKKLKKLSQPKYRVEIPVMDDSANSLTQLTFEVFSNLPISRKGTKPSILILWPNPTMLQLASQVFSSVNSVTNCSLADITPGVLSSADLAVFLSPESSQLEEIRSLTNSLYPKPVVLFNPMWSFEEEKGFSGGLESFVGTFDVVYSFMGLEVRGVIRRSKGVVFKFVKDGLASKEGWVIMVEEEGKNKGEFKMVSRFKRRPTIVEVENVLYNLMAANSPVTKSIKFLKDFASNVIRPRK